MFLRPLGSPLFLVALVGSLTAQGQWTLLPQAATPTARQSARMMAYDAANDRLVLFGGSPASGTYLGDTRVFACATNTWSQVTGGATPSPRYGHSMVYDPVRNEVVLFGGQLVNGNGPFNNETWAFAGTSWQQRTPTNAPPARFLHSATFDTVRGVMVLFGGGGPPATTSDTWEWDGVNWTLRATTIPSSAPLRGNSAIAYDPVRQRTVIFGGRTTTSFFNDTLEWDGTTWTNVTPATGNPGNRAAAAMAYDAGLNRIVMTNGNTATSQLNDTWYWNGTSWTQVFPGTPPLPRGNSGFAYDSARERLLLWGGSSTIGHYNELWAFRSATPARLQPFGQGCAGAIPAPTLAPADLRRPWLGDIYAIAVQGLPSSGIVVLVTGLSDQTFGGLPLPLSLAPLGMPGCDALVSPDVLDAAVHFGSKTFALTLPLQPAFAGQSFFHQALVLTPLAGNAFGGLVSNGMEAVLGLR